MKLRNINISLLILLALLFTSYSFFVTAQQSSSTNNIFLDSDQDGLTDEEEYSYGTNPHEADTDRDGYNDGAEVIAGYDPLKPAPGDKLSPEEKDDQTQIKTELLTADTADTETLTQSVAQKISILAEKSDPNNLQISLDQINQIVDTSLDSESSSIKIPEIDRSTLHIKEQNYSNKNEAEKKKEDFTKYVITIYYILSSNSPQPITSSTDIESLSRTLFTRVMSALTTQDISAISDLENSGEKMLEQLKEMEVPEELVDLHVKALGLAQYATEIQSSLTAKNDEDPLGKIVNLSNAYSYLGLLADFSSEIEAKFIEYDLTYDDEMKSKIEGYGLVAPDTGTLSAESILGN